MRIASLKNEPERLVKAAEILEQENQKLLAQNLKLREQVAKLEGKKPGEKRAEVAAGVPAGRFGTPEDLTGMALFLASAESDYIVSQTYNVDGGNWMS